MARHGRREHFLDRASLVDEYLCRDRDGVQVVGPVGGLDRLLAFHDRYGGLSFCGQPSCEGQHRYDLELLVDNPGWSGVDGDWVAIVGYAHSFGLTLSWSTGRIGIDLHGKTASLADSAVNLIESQTLAQHFHGGSPGWREAIPIAGKGRGWGLPNVTSDRFQGLVPEVTVASSRWNRWYVDEHVAVHGWQSDEREVVMAWYRDEEGRRRIESVAGALRG